MNAAINQFRSRQPALGQAYVYKDRLALADSGSKLLGVDEAAMCATFVISTDDPDRVDDVVTTKGIYLDNFKVNPIAFYGHQAIILPIGKWAERDSNRCTIRLQEHKATGTCYFSQKTREAEQVFALVSEGILRATSIGFNPMEEPQPRDGRKSNPLTMQRGYVFPKVDLLEVSIVGIPAQPTATLVREVLARTKVAGWPLLKPIRKSLEALAEPSPVWSNGGGPVSKKYGKVTPKGKTTPPPLPSGTLTKLLEMIPHEFKDALQDCVAQKIPKLLDEGYPQDQATAIAFSMCGEGKDLSGSDGAAGGYTVPEDDKKKKKAITVKQPQSALAGPPPDKKGDQAPRDQPAADAQPEQQPPEQPEPQGSDPKEVLGRLVDALTDYLEITKPAEAGPPEDEEEEPEPDEDDMPNQQQDQDEAVGDERYQFRAGTPAKKKGQYHPVARIKKCMKCMKEAADHLKELSDLDGPMSKSHKTASLHHHKELMGMHKEMDSPAEGEGNDATPPPESPESDVVEKALAVPPDLDLDRIMKALTPVRDRVVAVGNTWESLNGSM